MGRREETVVSTIRGPAVKPSRAARRAAQKLVTYERYVVTALLPATGWRAVFWDEGTHLVTPVQLLGLGYRRRYSAQSGRRLREAWREPEEERWEIVALDYTVTDGWNVLEDHSNFCGLCPAGTTLQEFEALSPCRAAHTTPLTPEEHFDLVAEMYDRRADDGPPSAGQKVP